MNDRHAQRAAHKSSMGGHSQGDSLVSNELVWVGKHAKRHTVANVSCYSGNLDFQEMKLKSLNISILVLKEL